MTTNLQVGEQFPDIELPDHQNELRQLFHFTALPGEGYRTIRAGTTVKFELVESGRGPTARNIQPRSMP